eukprot:scaffold56327_cov68-Phaeocystis_antarctica.AAC.14
MSSSSDEAESSASAIGFEPFTAISCSRTVPLLPTCSSAMARSRLVSCRFSLGCSLIARPWVSIASPLAPLATAAAPNMLSQRFAAVSEASLSPRGEIK